MLLGQYQSILESDRSLLVPVPFREPFTEGAYITRGFEQNLLVIGSKVFQDIYKRVVALNIADPLARLLLRLILGSAYRLDLDESGRAVVPSRLVSFAGLEKDIVLIGQGDYFEVWSPTLWEKQSADLLDTEANAKRFAQLDLAVHG